MDNQQFEFLDILTMLGFAMQLQNMTDISKQATNNDILKELQQDVVVINSKLDRLLLLAVSGSTDAGKHPSSAQSASRSETAQ